MSRTTWRSRSVLAAGTAAILVGTGVAALATTGTPPGDDAPPASAPQDTADDSLAELRRSVDDLMAQADALESSLAATPTNTTAAGASDGGQLDDVYDDHGDDDDDYDDDYDYDDDDDHDQDDDHGLEVEGDDD
jgi:hypothetical protein